MEVRYCAVDRAGKKRAGRLSGLSIESIQQDLIDKGWVVLSCQPISPLLSIFTNLSKKVSKEFVINFSRQVAVLLDSGVTLLQALEIIIEDTEHDFDKKLITQLSMDIQNGIAISKSMAQFSHIFGVNYIEIIAVGEQTGLLAQAFERNLYFLKAKQRLAAQVKQACTYPTIVLTVAIIVILVLMIKVVPGFQTLFENFDQQLPWATRQVIFLSDLVSANLIYLVMTFILLPVCYLLMTKSTVTKRYIDLLMWRIPIITTLYQMSFVTSFSLTAYSMLNAGLPLNQALSKIKNGTKNTYTKTKLLSVIESVQKGESFYQSLKQTALFPFMFLTLIKVGEETGRLDSTLKTLANIYQTRLEAHIKQIISLIEPTIVVLLGVIIGGLVLVMYLPIFEMSTFL